MHGAPVVVGAELETELAARVAMLRPASRVMAPETIGAARLTRYSFSRMMLRTASRSGWTAQRTYFDIDELGRGEAVYEFDTGDQLFSFVAFTTTLDESEHTDRVVANKWEITAGLVEGELTDELRALLRSEIPKQEAGRLDARILVLTRGNRSVRFFQYLVDTLAAGDQPDPDLVGDAGYIMRSTAFYGNGKYGMRSYEGYGPEHPFRVPYRAQFAAAWCYRELSYDVVEHCARLQGGDTAVGFDDEWSRYFGLGNATGLGLVPYAFKHPRVLNAWNAIREIALADVRVMAGDESTIASLERWIARAHRHFSDGTNDDCEPFLNAQQLAPCMEAIANAFTQVRSEPLPFDALYRWSETQAVETTELVVSLLIELHDGDDELVDRLLRVDEHAPCDPMMTVAEALAILDEHFAWVDELGLDGPDADAYWWVISDNTEEPRRALRSRLDPAHNDVGIGVALGLFRLRETLRATPADTFMMQVVADHPEHRGAVDRLASTISPYGEPRDNTCALGYLPLQVQRFQLAMYGMDNFKPKSTDWLRVTLFQGAPRLAELCEGLTDDWVLPPRPQRTASPPAGIGTA